ncbi:tetratricopeptide repeat protein [Candidatus Omnitrophota bacterium]
MKIIFLCLFSVLCILKPSFAELGGGLEDFKNSQFFKKYGFNTEAQPSEVRTGEEAVRDIDFRGKEMIEKISLHVDSKTGKIVRYIVYMNRPVIPENTFYVDKDKRDAFIFDFIEEATGQQIEEPELMMVLRDFDSSFTSVLAGKSPGINPFMGDFACKERYIAGNYFQVCGTLWGENILIESAERLSAARKDPLACALLVADTIQNSHAKSEARYKISMVYADAGRYDEAFRIARQTEEAFFRSKSITYLAAQYWKANEQEKARALLEEAQQVITEITDSYFKDWALLDLSVRYYSFGEKEKSEQMITEIKLDYFLLSEAAMMYFDIGNLQMTKVFLTKAIDNIEANLKKTDHGWSVGAPEQLAEIALKFLKIGEKEKASQVLHHAYDLALKTDELIKEIPWRLKGFALKCAEAGEFDLALKTVEVMGKQEYTSRYSNYLGNHVEKQNCPTAATLAEVGFFYLKAGQREKALEILKRALRSSEEIKYGKEKRLTDLLLVCIKMREYDPSLPLEEMLMPYFDTENMRKEMNTDPMEFFNQDFGGDPQRLIEDGKYLQAVQSAAMFDNTYLNQEFWQIREPKFIEIALAFAKSGQPIDENTEKFLAAIIEEIDWQAEEDKDTIGKSHKEEIEKNEIELLKGMSKDTSWVKIKAPVYYITGSQPMSSFDWHSSAESALYVINTDGTDNYKIFDGRFKEATLSPDGKYLLLVATTNDSEKSMVYLFDLSKRENKLIKEVNTITPQEGYHIVTFIHHISWSPNSQNFTYAVQTLFDFNPDEAGREKESSMKVSGYKESVYLINIEGLLEKEIIHDRYLVNSGLISEGLHWGSDGRHVYYSELKNEKYHNYSLDIENLKESELGSITDNLFKQRHMLHGGTIYGKAKAVSDKGEELYWGWDSRGNYYIHQDINGKKKMVISFPKSSMFTRSYFERPAWLPGGDYALFQFLDRIVVIELSTGKIGILADGQYLTPADYVSKEKWVY